MPIYNVGDQARAYALQMATGRLKTTMTTLTAEMASGEAADIGARVGGNTMTLSGIEARLAAMTQFQKNASDAAMLTRGMQDILEAVRQDAANLGIELATDAFAEANDRLGIRANHASMIFEGAVQRLNGTAGGRFLMSGLASDRPPLAPASQMLDSLTSLTAGMTDAADVAAAISGWFDAPPGGGGFLDNAYSGTVGQSQQVPIAEDMAISIVTSAASPAIRDVLKGLAMAALLDRSVLSGQQDQRSALLGMAGRGLLAAEHGLIGEKGRIGLTEQIIDRARSTSATAMATLQLSRAEIRSVDAFETAAALKEVDGQLETLYTVTARLSKLKLVDFLR
jgi:flagellar hook-associated protein 3 FlgL